LRERIAAVEHLPEGNASGSDSPAVTLLEDVPKLEKSLFETIAGPDESGKLKLIEWAQVRRQIHFPQWKKLIEVNAAVLAGVKPESLPSLAVDAKAFGQRCVSVTGEKPNDEHAEGLAGVVVGSALLLNLVNKGRHLQDGPGDALSVSLPFVSIEPMTVFASLASKKLDAAVWQRQCEAAGIVGLDLSKAPAEMDVKPTIAKQGDGDSRYMPKS
jgi:hypothetical protein